MKKVSEHFFYVSKHHHHILFKTLVMLNVLVILALISDNQNNSHNNLKQSLQKVINSVFSEESNRNKINDYQTFFNAFVPYIEVDLVEYEGTAKVLYWPN